MAHRAIAEDRRDPLTRRACTCSADVIHHYQKQCRLIATRYRKRAATFRLVPTLAAILHWL